MKIAILLESNYSGGGSFTHQVTTASEMIKYLGKSNEITIYTHLPGNLKILHNLQIPTILFKNKIYDKILIKLSVYKFFRIILKLLNCQINIEKILLNNKTDVIFFPSASNTIYALNKINFIFHLLDLEHWKHSIYPEITKKEFIYREKLYFYSLKKSLLNITNHKLIKKQIINHYKTNAKKINVIPYATQKNFFKKNTNKQIFFNKKYKKLKDYFFYPAQIWGHKNHLIILKAAKILQDKGYDIKFIFSGKDRGHKKILENYIKQHSIDNIIFTGFLPNDEMDYVYKNSKAIIFTSFFGPNTLVSLETWRYKKPLIYNRKLSDCPKDTAILIDPKNPNSVSNAIIDIINKKYKDKFITNGISQLKLIEQQNKNGYDELNKKLIYLKN